MTREREVGKRVEQRSKSMKKKKKNRIKGGNHNLAPPWNINRKKGQTMQKQKTHQDNKPNHGQPGGGGGK